MPSPFAASDNSRRQPKQPLIAGILQWRATLGPIVLASMLLNIFALCTPIVTMIVYNKVLPHHATATLTVLAVGAVIVYLFEAALRHARSALAGHAGSDLHCRIGHDLFEHVLSLPLRAFETTPVGGIAERLRQLDIIRGFLTGQLPMLLADLAFSAILLVALVLIDWRMGLLAVASLPVFVGLALYGDAEQKRSTAELFERASQRTALVHAMLANILTVKALHLERGFVVRHGDLLDSTSWIDFNSQHRSQLITTLIGLVYALVALTAVVLGAHLIMTGQMTVGALIAANMLLARIVSPIRQISLAWHGMRGASAAFAHITTLMQQPVEAHAAPSGRSPQQSTVTCQQLGYRYAPAGTAAIADVSITFAAGSATGIIGAAGSGKSTLGKLLVGAYPPTAGRVLLDGIDLTTLTPAVRAACIGYVPQECHLFAGTIRDNILIACPEASPARAVQAAQLVGAHAFIQSLPDGYDYVLGDDGRGLSGGQKQLLCIARAIVHQPRLLVLDEATSALDPRTEAMLLSRLKAITRTGSLTLVLITHRLTAAQQCDRVVELVDGRPVVRQPMTQQVATAPKVSADDQ